MSFKRRLIGNDVASRTGLKTANGYNAESGRILLAADHGLHVGYEMGRLDNRVDRFAWLCAMSAAPPEDNF